MVSGVVPPKWAELRLKEMVQGLEPSGIPWCQAMPKPVQEALPSGADSCSPEEPAVIVAVVLPAVALAVTLVGVLPVAHTQVSMPTRVAPWAPTFGFVSTVGAGIFTASQATLARRVPEIYGLGACCPAGTQMFWSGFAS